MQRISKLQNGIVKAAIQSAEAIRWHADKQIVWQNAIVDKDSLPKEFTTPEEAQKLMAQIQQQTVASNDAFPVNIESVTSS